MESVSLVYFLFFSPSFRIAYVRVYVVRGVLTTFHIINAHKFKRCISSANNGCACSFTSYVLYAYVGCIPNGGDFRRIYTVPVTIGAANQTFAVQVDTGSADFVRVFRLSTLVLISTQLI